MMERPPLVLQGLALDKEVDTAVEVQSLERVNANVATVLVHSHLEEPASQRL